MEYTVIHKGKNCRHTSKTLADHLLYISWCRAEKIWYRPLAHYGIHDDTKIISHKKQSDVS